MSYSDDLRPLVNRLRTPWAIGSDGLRLDAGAAKEVGDAIATLAECLDRRERWLREVRAAEGRALAARGNRRAMYVAAWGLGYLSFRPMVGVFEVIATWLGVWP